MLRVKWVGLLLAFWVTNTLQQDVALDEGRKNEVLQNKELLKYIQERLKNSNASEYVNKLRSESDSPTNAPKKVKITFRRRYRVRKGGKEVDETTPSTKIYESFTSDDKKILPVLLDYLKNHTGGEIRTLDEKAGDKYSTDVDNAGVEIQLIEIQQTIDKGEKDFENNTQSEEDSLESKANRRGWNSNARTPDEDQAHEKSVISKNKVVNPVNVNRIIAKRKYKSLKADDKAKETTNNAISKEFNASKTDLLIKQMCESSKSNVLEFWKSAAKYFGLDDENLSDKQKYDLFTIILKKGNLRRKQEDVDISKPEKESEELKVEPSQNFSEVNLLESPELEKQKDQKSKLNENFLFLSANKTVIKPFNKSKQVEYVTSKSDYIAEPEEPSQDVISEFENRKETINTIASEKTAPEHNLAEDNYGDDNISYDDGVLFQINKSSKENTEQNQDTTYVIPESYDFPEIFLADTEKRANVSESSGSDEANIYAETFEETFNPDNDLFLVSDAKRRSFQPSERTPINTDAKQILQEINEIFEKDEVKSVTSLEIPNVSGETSRSDKFEVDNNRLESLLQRLDSLPNDEVDKVVKYLKEKSKKSYPKINSMSNIDMKPVRDVDKVLLQIISRFTERGISDDALREIVIDLQQTLSEGNDECQSVKISKIKKAFEKLLDLQKKSDT